MLTATSHTKSQFTLGLTNIDISDVCSKPSDGTPLALGEIQSLEHVFHSLAARLLSHHLLLLPSHQILIILSSCPTFHFSGPVHTSSYHLNSFPAVLLQASPLLTLIL